ncbi:MAG: hybrid sensor histidine kinase/response regulator transcription factor [Bacteroidota bacterium]
MKRILNITLLLTIGIMACCVNIAQPPSVKFSHLTILDGLSNNTVLCIHQDSQGFMWFGTRDGLNRYDGYHFTIYRASPENSRSLSGNHIQLVYEDNNGNLWVNSEVNSLDVYLRERDCFITIQEFLNDSSIEIQGLVRAMLHDSQNNLWLGTSQGLIRYDYDAGKTTYFESNESIIEPRKLINPSIYQIIEDYNNHIWVATYRGLLKFDYSTGEFSHFTVETHGNKGMISDMVTDLTLVNDSTLYISTTENPVMQMNTNQETFTELFRYEGPGADFSAQKIIKAGDLFWISADNGLYTYHAKSGDFSHHHHDDKYPGSITSNNVLDLFLDKAGTVWISHWHDGISYFNICENKFDHFKKEPCINSINNNTVRCILMDNEKNLWLGTDQGGINMLNAKTGLWQYYTIENQPGLSSNLIKDLIVDQNGNLLAATSRGIAIFRKRNHDNSVFLDDITHQFLGEYEHEVLSRLQNSNVEQLFIDYHGDLWIGTSSNLFILEEKNITITSISDGRYNPIYSIFEDFEGTYWIGSHGGLYTYNKKTGEFTNEGNKLNINNGLLRINTITEDENRNLWIGTNGQGLYILDTEREISFIDDSTGLPSKVVNALIEDGPYMWITTNRGLVKFDKKSYKILNTYNHLDGLQSDQFYRNSALRIPDGDIYIGGVNGFNRFRTDNIVSNSYLPPVILTDLKINNESITPDHPLFGKVIDQHIEIENNIILNHKHSVISFEFGSLNFLTPEKNQYAYKFEGFSEDEDKWNYIGNQRIINYTNLVPGEYKLMIKSANNDGIWNEKPRIVNIKVMPPWWKTVYFKTFVILLALGIIFLFKKWITYNVNLRNEVRVERLEKDKIQEVEEMKLRFFTNISHEFRTPLTLILSPLEKLSQSKRIDNEEKVQVSLMLNNAKRLLRLVNQIMDLRKIEAGKLRLETRYGDLVAFIRDIISSFEELAREKSIRLMYNTISEQIFSMFDEDKIDKVIFNLLSNAFKYTPEGGTITVSVALISKTLLTEGDQEKLIEICVEDNGKGIPRDARDKIFDRFYQHEDNSVGTRGTGIGLSLTKDLVELHKGKIEVQSTTNEEQKGKTGTRFIIHLPYLANDNNYQEVIAPEVRDKTSPARNLTIGNGKVNPCQNNIILVIEDNQDMRLFIKSSLFNEFKILEATNGKEGFEMAVENIPDLILCDVMMPEMNGIELVQKLKNDARTSHVPVVFLTAKASEESRITGLETGAEDYITKPFSVDILKQRITNILNARKVLQEKFSKEILLEPTNVKIVSYDEKFLERSVQIVEKFMDDPDFNVDQLSKEVGISRIQLYRKMNALINLTPNEFIKLIRSKRAAQLLGQKAINISEVTYAVGFRDTSYFRKCFKKQYGISPSEFMKNDIS